MKNNNNANAVNEKLHNVGVVTAKILRHQEGPLSAVPGAPVYEGMIIGEHNRNNDLNGNPCKPERRTDMRASGRDDAVVLTPILRMTAV